MSTPIRGCAWPPRSPATAAPSAPTPCPARYADLDEADLIVLVGSNAAWCHPVLFQRMMRNKAERGARVVVIDPRRTVTAEEADLFLPIAPGTDTALFCGLLVDLAERGAIDAAYVDAHTDRLCRSAGAGARDCAGQGRHRPRHRPGRGRSRPLLRSVLRHRAGRHLFFAGREPVGAGHRQGQRHHQLPPRHRPHRPARHGAVLAHRPAQRHGRARGRRARQSARRPYGLHAGRDRPRAPVLERAAHGDARRAQGGRRCSRRSSAARSRRCG